MLLGKMRSFLRRHIGLHVLTLAATFWIPLTFICTYIISVSLHHVTPFLPKISQTGTKPPESCVFSELLNLGSAFGTVVLYVRYKYIECYLQSFPSERVSKWNRIGLWCSVGHCFGFLTVANFQVTLERLTHNLGVFLAFTSGLVLYWSQTYISFKMRPAWCTNWVAHVRFLLSAFFTFCTTLGAITGGLSHYYFKGKNKMKWKKGDGGYELYVFSSVLQWLSVVTIALYIATFATEFKFATVKWPSITWSESNSSRRKLHAEMLELSQLFNTSNLQRIDVNNKKQQETVSAATPVSMQHATDKTFTILEGGNRDSESETTPAGSVTRLLKPVTSSRTTQTEKEIPTIPDKPKELKHYLSQFSNIYYVFIDGSLEPWLLALAVSVAIPMVFMITWATSIALGHVKSYLPAFSEAADVAPESCILAQCLNFVAAVMAFVFYFRYRYVLRYLEDFPDESVEDLNVYSLWAGLFHCLGFTMVANFQTSNVKPLHLLGIALIIFSGNFLYWFQVKISYSIRPVGCTNLRAGLRLIVAGMFTVFSTISFISASVAYGIYAGHKMEWISPECDAYPSYIVGSSTQWVAILSIAIFVSTYVSEFKCLEVKFGEINWDSDCNGSKERLKTIYHSADH